MHCSKVMKTVFKRFAAYAVSLLNKETGVQVSDTTTAQ